LPAHIDRGSHAIATLLAICVQHWSTILAKDLSGLTTKFWPHELAAFLSVKFGCARREQQE
jgi:hypothetical protein